MDNFKKAAVHLNKKVANLDLIRPSVLHRIQQEFNAYLIVKWSGFYALSILSRY